MSSSKSSGAAWSKAFMASASPGLSKEGKMLNFARHLDSGLRMATVSTGYPMNQQNYAKFIKFAKFWNSTNQFEWRVK